MADWERTFFQQIGTPYDFDDGPWLDKNAIGKLLEAGVSLTHPAVQAEVTDGGVTVRWEGGTAFVADENVGLAARLFCARLRLVLDVETP